MSTKWNFSIVAGLTLGLCNLGLHAQDGSRLKQMDKNGDGRISQDEAPGPLWERLSALDANQDGAVSPEEMAKGRPGGSGAPGGGAFFETADKNGDGKITADEAGERWERMSKADKDGDGAITKMELVESMRAAGSEFFASVDKNGDGKITADEAGERWERMSRADKNGDGAVTRDELAEGMRNAGGGGTAGPVGRPDPAQFFARMDKNSDGAISQNEAPAEAWTRLSQADANSDGKVTAEELKSARGNSGPGAGASGGAGQIPKRPPVES